MRERLVRRRGMDPARTGAGLAGRWHRIDATGMPRVAPQQAAQGEPRTARSTMGFDGLDRIVRAARVEAAVRAEEGAQDELIAAQHEADQTAEDHRGNRFQCAVREARRCALSAAIAARRQSTTTSTAGNDGRAARKLSRITRLSRLRATARGAQRLEMASPRRACGAAAWLA